MYSAHGIGLARSQVGVHKQLLVIDLDPENQAHAAVVLIIRRSARRAASLETYERKVV